MTDAERLKKERHGEKWTWPSNVDPEWKSEAQTAECVTAVPGQWKDTDYQITLYKV